METDPVSLDPEERQNKFFALMSVALGLLSLCASIVPYCGGGMAILGIILGLIGRNSEQQRMAVIGVAVSTLGLLIAITFAIFVYLAGTPS